MITFVIRPLIMMTAGISTITTNRQTDNMMKRKATLLVAALLMGAMATNAIERDTHRRAWNHHLQQIVFEDKDQGSRGSNIYHAIVPDPDGYIRRVARQVMRTLYYSPKDSLPMCRSLHYTLRDDPGISAKGGNSKQTSIFYSTRHVAKAFGDGDTAKVDFETRGVLLHELTHVYQLEPKGIGHYGQNPTVTTFIEGMADAVRIACDGFHDGDRPKGGHYTRGYRYTGYFLDWLRRTYRADFLKRLNYSTRVVIPWNWDDALSYAFGQPANAEALWTMYMQAMGEKTHR